MKVLLILLPKQITWGFGLAAGVRVGHFLGAQDPQGAQTSANVAITGAGMSHTEPPRPPARPPPRPPRPSSSSSSSSSSFAAVAPTTLIGCSV